MYKELGPLWAGTTAVVANAIADDVKVRLEATDASRRSTENDGGAVRNRTMWPAATWRRESEAADSSIQRTCDVDDKL